MTDKPRAVVEVIQGRASSGTLICDFMCPQKERGRIAGSICRQNWDMREERGLMRPGPNCPGPSKGKGYALVDVMDLEVTDGHNK